MSDVRSYAELDERELKELRNLAPTNPWTRTTRILFWFEGRGLPDRILRNLGGGCSYCGRRAKTSMLAVSPITLQRRYYPLCSGRRCGKKLRAWEGRADSRRRRAQYDWERQNPEVAALALISNIPPQYPSISRATLRAFLDSDEDIATVEDGSNVSTLNGSIKSLGFVDQVYAELRSGKVVLRKVIR